MSEGAVLVAEEQGIRTLTLNRPARRNALSDAMREELTAALRAAGDDAACRVVVLAGVGEAFCAGLDLKALAAPGSQTAAERDADAQQLALLFRTLHECAKPTIAAVRGAAIGGGAGLATICDFTLAEPEAFFAYPEVKIGFVPALVSAYLVLQVGEKRVRDLLLTGRRVDAEEALQLGLVNEVVPRGELAKRTRELAGTLIGNSPEAMRATKALLAAQNKLWLDAALDEGMAVNARARGTKDFREGVEAFLERRKPVWPK
ncbi:MAG: enoyl-CoA hydratase-related protein [Acidobacteriaceae bacterium]